LAASMASGSVRTATMDEVQRRYHWTDGNGALPFPAQRIEFTYPSEAIYGTVYEVREYLGNAMVVSYREVFQDDYPIPEGAKWHWVRRKFEAYLEDPHG
jgi:hypothetical protein